MVEVGILEDDQNCRDFMINVFVVSLNEEDFGIIIDFFYGFQDLENKLIKILLELGKIFLDDLF